MPIKLVLHLLWAAAVFLAAASTAYAEDQRVDITRNGVTTTLVLPQYTTQGVPYASFADIARQLGARVEVGEARAAMVLDGVRAEAGLEDTQATVNGENFTLKYPVRFYKGDALIAVEDLTHFLREGFGIGTPDNPPTTSALRMEREEPQLESVVTPSTTSTPASDNAADADKLEDTSLESISAAPQPITATPLDQPGTDNTPFHLAIDAGHGGDDSGAQGKGGLLEKTVCLSVAGQLRQLLKDKYGIDAVMTREQDETKSIQTRGNTLNREHVSVVLSIHAGASNATEKTGPLLFADQPRLLLSTAPKPALALANALAGTLATEPGASPVPVHESALLLMHRSGIPGVLVELGNLANPEIEAQLADASYQAALAAALAQGINQVVQNTATGRTAP